MPLKSLAAAALLAAAPLPLLAAGTDGFTLVNSTAVDFVALSIRRFGTEQWIALGGRGPAGARQAIRFSDPDCAFDLRATLASGERAIWRGVNLCQAGAVVLNRDPASGATWADYE